MGWNDHVEWDLLNNLELLVEDCELDPEEDGELIAAIEAVAGYANGVPTSPTPEQQALFDKKANWIYERAEAIEREQHMAYLLGKDD